MISVTDAAPGIPRRAAEQRVRALLARPQQRRPQGSGLGLAIVRATAERHGGALSVDGAALHDRRFRLSRDLSDTAEYETAANQSQEST